MAEIQAPYVAGFFADPDEWTKAVEASTAKGHKNHDGYMPYPIHGFDHSFGYKRSYIGRVVLAVLLLGAVGGFFMQYWMMKADWPIIIGGKPYNSWPAYVVITFESGIISGAVTNFLLCLLIACRLYPRPDTQGIKPELTDDVFALCIPVEGNGTPESIKQFLEEQGADDIGLYIEEDSKPSLEHEEEEAARA